MKKVKKVKKVVFLTLRSLWNSLRNGKLCAYARQWSGIQSKWLIKSYSAVRFQLKTAAICWWFSPENIKPNKLIFSSPDHIIFESRDLIYLPIIVSSINNVINIFIFLTPLSGQIINKPLLKCRFSSLLFQATFSVLGEKVIKHINNYIIHIAIKKYLINI